MSNLVRTACWGWPFSTAFPVVRFAIVIALSLVPTDGCIRQFVVGWQPYQVFPLYAVATMSVIFRNLHLYRECVRNLDLRVQVHPGELWVSKQRVHTVLEASKSAGAKGDVPKICGFVNPLHPL